MNKKIIVSLLGFLIVTLACGSTAPSVSDQPGVETVVAATLQAVTQEAANQPTQSSGIQVSYQNVNFVIPEGLAIGANSETVPAADESVGGPWGVAPEYIQFTLTGYPVTSEGFEPVIRIYPAKEYADINSWAASSLVSLQAILASPSMAVTNENAPTIPFNGAAAQLYAAQAQRLSFNGGNGVRSISYYAQFPAFITKDNNFYHYEGLTTDGRYLVAILFPAILPLQATKDDPSADGVTYPSDFSDEGLNAYYQGITDKLNSNSPDAFQPNLNLLDALIQSIQIQ